MSKQLTKAKASPRELQANVPEDFEAVISSVVCKEQWQILSGDVPDYAIKTRPGRGGQTFRYITHGYVTQVLNRAFGMDWSFEIMPVFNGNVFHLTPADPARKLKSPNIAVTGKLTVRVRDPKDPTRVIAEIVKTASGSQNWEDAVEFGDALKGAGSDALKKCASLLGVGNKLYWDDEFELQQFETQQMEMQHAQQEMERPPSTIVELISKANSIYGIDAVELAKRLGVNSIVEIKDFRGAWEKLGANTNGNSH
jgi:hypothetical protein